MEVLKGVKEKVVVEPWLSPREGSSFVVSVGTFFLKPGIEPKYLPTGKTFNLTPGEAREVAAAMLAIADQVEKKNVAIDESLIAQGKL